MQTKPRVSKG